MEQAAKLKTSQNRICSKYKEHVLVVKENHS